MQVRVKDHVLRESTGTPPRAARAFVVENLNADADVAGTQTSLIFEHLRGASPL